jgi:hypothetical protein
MRRSGGIESQPTDLQPTHPVVVFRNRMSWQPKAKVRYPVLNAGAYQDARLAASGYDVYALEGD